MDLFVVDRETCTLCGACIAECPRRLLEIQEMPDGDLLPAPVEGAEELCITCGHCVAVCPPGALALRTMAPEQCAPVRDEWCVAPEKIAHFLASRRSIRSFKDTAVDRELLAKLIDVARIAPSGSNGQPVSWLVVSGGDEVHRLAAITMDWACALREKASEPLARRKADQMIELWESGVDIICREAPHVIIAHAPPGARTDCIIALTYLELAAYAFGLGPCWAGWLDGAANQWQPMKEHLGLPAGHTMCGGMMVGYPEYAYHRLPLRNEARVTWR